MLRSECESGPAASDPGISAMHNVLVASAISTNLLAESGGCGKPEHHAMGHVCCSVMQAMVAITLLKLVYNMELTCAAAAGCTCAVRTGAHSGIQRMPRLLEQQACSFILWSCRDHDCALHPS